MTRSAWALRSLLASLLLLAACAVPPGNVEFQASQAALLRGSLDRLGGPTSRPRLFYIGLALYPETWSRNDVVDVEAALARGAPSYDVVPLVMSNFVTSIPKEFPVVDGADVERATAEVARHVRQGDVVFVFISSHGIPGGLLQQVGAYPRPPVDAAELRRWLEPLAGHETVLVLSACFSGSLIGALQADDRIILTAARADRTSFGCRAGAEHTAFGSAILSALATPGQSLEGVFAATRANVAALERESRFRPPSEPQVDVGAEAGQLYRMPAF